MLCSDWSDWSIRLTHMGSDHGSTPSSRESFASTATRRRKVFEKNRNWKLSVLSKLSAIRDLKIGNLSLDRESNSIYSGHCLNQFFALITNMKSVFRCNQSARDNKARKGALRYGWPCLVLCFSQYSPRPPGVRGWTGKNILWYGETRRRLLGGTAETVISCPVVRGMLCVTTPYQSIFIPYQPRTPNIRRSIRHVGKRGQLAACTPPLNRQYEAPRPAP